MADGRATIKDVAALAGVSISTVSRTLSGKMFVEPATRERVMSAVKELNYEPNMIARGLKERKTNTIAVVIPEMNSLYYSVLTGSIEKYAAAKGYSVILGNSHGSLENEKKTLDVLCKRCVDGVICMCINDTTDHIQAIRESYGTPMLFINRELHKEISSVSIDGHYGGYLMTSYLLKNGHKRIAGVFESLEKQRYRERFHGYKKALEEEGLEVREEYVLEGVEDIESAYRSAKELFSMEEYPTAVFVSGEMMVLGIYRAVFENGLKIPDDVSVVGFDNVITAEYMIPPLTTYDSMIDELARIGVENLIGQIEKKKKVKRVKIKGAVIERASVKKMEDNL